MNPARMSSAWLGATASLGASRRVGTKRFDQRMAPRLATVGRQGGVVPRSCGHLHRTGHLEWSFGRMPFRRRSCHDDTVTDTRPLPFARRLLFLLVFAAAVAACGSAGATDDAAASADDVDAPSTTAEPTTTVDAAAVGDVTFAATVQPIIEASCAGCHAEGGPGAFHMQLSMAADVVANTPFIAAAVDTGYMPPWPSGDRSVAFHDDRRMAAGDIAAVLAWVDGGAELDVDASTPIVPAFEPPALTEVDLVVEPHEAYEGSDDIDDYRCFIYDPGLTEAAWMVGYEFVPDQTEIVHHAIGYHMSSEAVALGLARSVEDEVGGWQCYGSSGLDAPDPLFLGWAPGQNPTELPDGSGIRLEPGDVVVMQIHYHNEVAVDPDRSLLRIDLADDPAADLDHVETTEYLAPAEIPCSAFEDGPLCDRDASLADARARFGGEGVQAEFVNRICGVEPDDFAHMTDGLATSACTLPVYEFGELIAVLGHQHEIGSSFRMTLNKGRDDELVLLDIPVWDFDWQLNYELVEPVTLEPGDLLTLECAWDRDLRDPELEPRWILWADGTDDEMCFATLTLRQD